MVATRLLRLVPAATTSARRAVLTGRAVHGPRTAVPRCLSTAVGGHSGNGDDNDSDDLRRPNGLHSSSVNGANDDDDMNPFERLLQHSQQFRQQMDKAEQLGLDVEDVDAAAAAAEAAATEENAIINQGGNDDDDSSDSDSDDSDSDSDSDSSDSDSDSDDDDDDEDAHAARFSKRSDRNVRRSANSPHARDHRAARAARSVRRRILNAPEDELDYEHELSKLQYARAKERKYQQLIHREQDKDRVCRNCGERGHVAKHCLLPMICSNCGGIGHRMRDCIYPDYVSSDSLADADATYQRHKQQRVQQSVADKHRMGKRFDKFKEEFDSQIEEYLAQSEVTAAKRRARKAEKLAAQQKDHETMQDDFKPVIG